MSRIFNLSYSFVCDFCRLDLHLYAGTLSIVFTINNADILGAYAKSKRRFAIKKFIDCNCFLQTYFFLPIFLQHLYFCPTFLSNKAGNAERFVYKRFSFFSVIVLLLLTRMCANFITNKPPWCLCSRWWASHRILTRYLQPFPLLFLYEFNENKRAKKCSFSCGAYWSKRK